MKSEIMMLAGDRGGEYVRDFGVTGFYFQQGTKRAHAEGRKWRMCTPLNI